MDRADRHVYICSYLIYALCSSPTRNVDWSLYTLSDTVRSDLAVAHCGVFNGVKKGPVLDRLKQCFFIASGSSYRGDNLLSHIFTCIRPRHYTLLSIMQVSPCKDLLAQYPYRLQQTADDTPIVIPVTMQELPQDDTRKAGIRYPRRPGCGLRLRDAGQIELTRLYSRGSMLLTNPNAITRQVFLAQDS